MMYQFWLPFVVLTIAIIYCDRKYDMLRDISQADPKPYSWSRVQLALWSVIVLSSFIAIIWSRNGVSPTLHYSTLVLLGISAATTATARVIDVSDEASNTVIRHQNYPADNFLVDILSDHNGISIHRFQAVVFNLLFGVWFIITVLTNLVPGVNPCTIYTGTPLMAQCMQQQLNFIMPVISDNNLILLGLSSATYAALKTTENKITDPTPPPGNNNPGNPGNPPPPGNPNNAAPANMEEQPVG